MYETIADINYSRKTTEYPTSVADMTLVPISSRGAIDGGVVLKIEPWSTTELARDDSLADYGLDQREQSPKITANLPIRKSSRDFQSSTIYPSSEYILLTNERDPKSFKEVQSLKDE